MKNRFRMQQVLPEGYKILLQLEQFLGNSPVNKKHSALIKLRASQINGCAFCLHMHLQEALRLGEGINRINLLSVWKDSPGFFDEQEQAVLALTEAVTRIGENGVSDETYEKCLDLFGEQYTAYLILTIVTINSWNRIARSLETPPGESIVRPLDN